MTISRSLNARAMLDDMSYWPEDDPRREAVREALERLQDACDARGLKCPGDDGMAECEAVLWNFLREAN